MIFSSLPNPVLGSYGVTRTCSSHGQMDGVPTEGEEASHPEEHVTGTENQVLLLEQRCRTGVCEGRKRPEPGPFWAPRGGGSFLQWQETTGRRCVLWGSSLNTTVGNRPAETALDREADDEGTRWQNVTPLSPCFSFSAHSFLPVSLHSLTSVGAQSAPLLLGIPSPSYMLRGATPVGTKLRSSLQGGLAGVTLPQEELYHWTAQQML